MAENPNSYCFSSILMFNHPGGSARSSHEDISLTKRIEKLLEELEVQLLDHLIYTLGRLGQEGKWVSLKAEGHLASLLFSSHTLNTVNTIPQISSYQYYTQTQSVQNRSLSNSATSDICTLSKRFKQM